MKYEQMKAVLDTIKAYDRIIIFRHKMPDGDAIGSSKGLHRILKLSFPEKEIYLLNSDYSSHLAFLGGEDEPIPDEMYKDALGIVVDTATAARISNKKFSLCKSIVKIDHHIPVESYGDVEWIMEDYSSSCEMIAEFYSVFKDELKIDAQAATYIYCGMVTDSGRFKYRSVSGDTLRLAAMLIDLGIDLDTLYANLYMKEYHTLKFRSYVYDKMKISENGVVYIYVDKKTREKYGLSIEDASACVGYIDNIKNSLIWLAFIETEDNIRVRLRSRFVTVSELAEKYGGGGHACAAGANVKNTAQMRRLVKDADELLKKYKQENEGWL